MNFDLKAPCKQCPFRTDIEPFITLERARSILYEITKCDNYFICHKTLVYDDDGDESVPSSKDSHCAGATILLEKMENPNQMMRIGERLEVYNPDQMKMDSPVYESSDEMLRAFIDYYQNRNRRRNNG